MARPKSKDELIVAASTSFSALHKLMDSLTEEETSSLFDFSADVGKKEAHWRRDRCLRDVLVHLHEWHELLLVWIDANLNQRPQPFLPDPYTWKTYGQMNEEFFRSGQAVSFEVAKAELQSSHDRAMGVIAGFSNAELFDKQHFNWTGTTTLGSYCVSATSSHYEWASKKLRAHLKRIRG